MVASVNVVVVVVVLAAGLSGSATAFTQNCSENVVMIARRTTYTNNETWVVHNIGSTKTKWRRVPDAADAIVHRTPVRGEWFCADWLSSWDVHTDPTRPDCYNATTGSRCAGYASGSYRIAAVCSQAESFYLRVEWPIASQVFAFYQNRDAYRRSAENAVEFEETVKRLFEKESCQASSATRSPPQELYADEIGFDFLEEQLRSEL